MFIFRYKLSESEADIMYNIPYYMGAIFTPFMGLIIDKIGKRPFFLVLAGILITFVNSWYLLMPASEEKNFLVPIIGQSVLGNYVEYH